MNGAWDKKVAKFILAANRSRPKPQDLVISDWIGKTVFEVAKGLTERKNHFWMTFDQGNHILLSRKESLKRRFDKLKLRP